MSKYAGVVSSEEDLNCDYIPLWPGDHITKKSDIHSCWCLSPETPKHHDTTDSSLNDYLNIPAQKKPLERKPVKEKVQIQCSFIVLLHSHICYVAQGIMQLHYLCVLQTCL
ncbi:hypothetical protein AMECASPLE_011669 [Ameca splendens]|uniref:Uncharacterized protein n=1 Tax=Ameca splendens TaxID=208324 RepID=A0ABV0ZY55_9TELE